MIKRERLQNVRPISTSFIQIRNLHKQCRITQFLPLNNEMRLINDHGLNPKFKRRSQEIPHWLTSHKCFCVSIHNFDRVINTHKLIIFLEDFNTDTSFFNFPIWSDIMAFSGETTRTQLLLIFSRQSTTKGTSRKIRDLPIAVGNMHKQSCFFKVTAYKAVCCSSYNTKPANLSAVIDSRNASSNLTEAILTTLLCFQYLPSSPLPKD